MVDKELIQYIKENKKKHGVEKLRKGLLKQGVSEEEIQEALGRAKEEDKAEEIVEEEKNITKDSVGNMFDAFLKTIGISRQERSFYKSVIIYGSISFVFANVIITVFQYISGRIVFAQIADSLGIFGQLALPGVFAPYINLFSVFYSLFWSIILGAVIVFLFFRYLLGVWPFRLWDSLFKKVFAFFLIIELFFTVFLNGILVAVSPIYLLGYLIIIAGEILASYIATFYIISNLERKHSKIVSEITRKSI